MIRILDVFLLIQLAHALVLPRVVSRNAITRTALLAREEPVWQIDSDSSEIEAKSSADLRREREEQERLAREEAERKAREEAERIAMEAAAKESQNKLFARGDQKEKAVVTTSPTDRKEVTSSGSTPASYGLSSGNNSAFDIGLLIAFPVIVGTLALFFIFPFLGPQFADTLPPVPLE